MQRKEKELLEAAMQSQEDVEKEMQVPSLLSLLAFCWCKSTCFTRTNVPQKF